MFYPLKFEPVYKEILWGGDTIRKKFKRTTPFDKVAESWELCCRPDGMSVVANGEFTGKTLEELIHEYGETLLGTTSILKYGKEFPLLVKIIDANDKLSVQVHPDDAYAQAHGEKNGKNELWYIIDAKPDARLVYGLKDGVTKGDFSQAVSTNQIGSTLREVPVKPGDAFYIPAGTVHAILDGILIAEIQQNSNTTYRIYDWGRVGANGQPRELHIDKAFDVIAFGKTLPVQNTAAASKTLCGEIARSDFFNIDEINLKGKHEGRTTGESFQILMNLEGNCTLSSVGGKTNLASGDTVLLPANLGDYTLEGKTKLLLTWI